MLEPRVDTVSRIAGDALLAGDFARPAHAFRDAEIFAFYERRWRQAEKLRQHVELDVSRAVVEHG